MYSPPTRPVTKPDTSTQSILAAANHALRADNYPAAMAGYVNAMQQIPELAATLAANIAHTRRKYLASRSTAKRLNVFISGCEPAHAVAGRANTLAQIYQQFSDVEISSSLGPNVIIDQALAFAAAHPAEIVHLCSPRAPNILVGILYKLLWGARVILDIDDQDPAPPLDQITQTGWACLTAELPDAFDAITVANAALQQRFGGQIIGHAASAVHLHRLISDAPAGVLSPALDQLCRELARHAPVLNLLNTQPAAPLGKLAIAVHVYYPEIWPEIAQRLKALHYPFVLDITTAPEQSSAVEHAVKQEFPAARIHVTPNQGMDILPFLSLVPRWQQEGILAVCKLHTKKGEGDGIATQWRKHLLETLVGHPDTPGKIAQAFAENPHLSLVGPAALYLSGQRLMYENRNLLEQLNQTLHLSPLPQTDWGFFAGTMFWARPSALTKLAGLAMNTAPSAPHQYAKDGQREHALERFFGLIPHYVGNGGGQIGLLHAPDSRNETPTLNIFEAEATDTPHLIQRGHATQAVRDTLARIDWLAQQSKPRQPKLVSIIVPVYNQPQLTAACVTSLYQHTDRRGFELILVDNGSDAPTQALLQDLAHQHSNLRLLRNPENLNFATGCNQGFAASQGETVIFLNNDTTLTPNWFPPLVDALRRPNVGIVQPKLLYPDGSIQCIGIVFSDKSPLGYPIYAGMKPEATWATRSRSFQAVTGACMALRAADFAALRGFDPTYINGQEDIDLCLRLNQREGRLCGWVAAESTVIHHESKSAGRFTNVETNRRVFVQRWKGKAQADDLGYYAEDGFGVTRYEPDSTKWATEALQTFRPKLVRKATVPS